MRKEQLGLAGYFRKSAAHQINASGTAEKVVVYYFPPTPLHGIWRVAVRPVTSTAMGYLT